MNVFRETLQLFNVNYLKCEQLNNKVSKVLL